MDKLSSKILNKIQKSYNFSNLKLVRKVKTGYLSHNFIVSDGRKNFFLKQHRNQEKEIIDTIFLVEDFFSKHKVPVIKPILTNKGEKKIKVEDHFYSLLPFIRAKTISRKTTNSKILLSTASHLAFIHKVSKKYQPKLAKKKKETNAIRRFWAAESKIENAFKKFKGNRELLKISQKTFKLKQDIILNNKIKQQSLKKDDPILLHGDYHLKNLFFSKNNQVKYIFDWEKTALGSRYFELIRAVDLIVFGSTDNKIRWKKAKIFLNEYHKQFPINVSIFRDALIDFHLGRVCSTWLTRELYLNNNTRIIPLITKEFDKIIFYENNIEKYVKVVKEIVK